jgi:hypothetical protein
MFGVAVMIFVSAVAAWTIPDSVPGTVADGARMIVALQGTAFNVIAIGYGVVWAWRNRQTIREFLNDLRSLNKPN